MRGEDYDIYNMLISKGGSPPHARGRREHMTPQELAKRITPACAGKTFRFAHEVVEKMDHPRMRGEDS